MRASAAAALLLSALPAPPAAAIHRRVPESMTGWLDVHAGAVVQADLGGEFLPDGLDGQPVPAFGAGAHFRTPRVDVGAFVAHTSGHYYSDDGEVLRLPGSTRAAALVRWRFLEGSWGALASTLAPGWTGQPLGRGFRRSLAPLADAPQSALPSSANGFTLGIGLSLLFHVDPRSLWYVGVESTNDLSTVRGGERELPLSVSRTLLHAGYQWRM